MIIDRDTIQYTISNRIINLAYLNGIRVNEAISEINKKFELCDFCPQKKSSVYEKLISGIHNLLGKKYITKQHSYKIADLFIKNYPVQDVIVIISEIAAYFNTSVDYLFGLTDEPYG